ncbi:MAG TPA: MarR family transcriptional regulator [Micrococcaceae bacterium]|jgi:hypothetical protein|nr:MarR family transcriptional regulator [Micrococcaceae bacterium]
MTMDQRGSRKDQDRVPGLLELLRDVPVVLAFERSVGDEVQGVLSDAGVVVDVVLKVLRLGGWYIGIGAGAVQEPLPRSPREASGPAFVAARQAVERAKKMGERVPVSVRADPASGGAMERGAAAEAVLSLLGRLVRNRTEAEWRVLDLLRPGARGQQVEVASRLGISPQAVSKAVFRSGWQEEQGGRAAATILLELADQ